MENAVWLLHIQSGQCCVGVSCLLVACEYIYIYIYICCAFVGLDNELFKWNFKISLLPCWGVGCSPAPRPPSWWTPPWRILATLLKWRFESTFCTYCVTVYTVSNAHVVPCCVFIFCEALCIVIFYSVISYVQTFRTLKPGPFKRR
jgi:hypothetical protein